MLHLVCDSINWIVFYAILIPLWIDQWIEKQKKKFILFVEDVKKKKEQAI